MNRFKKHLIPPNGMEAALAAFRILFGVLMLFSLVRFASNGWIESQYILPQFLFPFFGFEWLPRPTPFFTYSLFALQGIGAIGIIIGWRFRLFATLFFLAFTDVELLDKTNYLNHYYFVTLLSFAIIFMPLDRRMVLKGNGKKWPAIKINYLLALRIILGGVYIMAGIAKLNPEWLLEAMPLKLWLAQNTHLPLISSLMDKTWVAYSFSWFGAIYDLSIPFFLSWKRSRSFAFVAVVLFHVATWLLFPIGMFPWIMIICSSVFLPASFWKNLLDRFLPKKPRVAMQQPSLIESIFPYAFGLVLFFLFIFPWRFVLYPDQLYWTEQGYRFSWRVMLMEKAGNATFYISDGIQNGAIEVDNSRFLTPNQIKQMSTQPDMILQYAHLLEKEYKKQGIANPQVRVESFVTINGKGSRLYINPKTDLTELQENWSHKSWIIPSDSLISPSEYLATKRRNA